LNKIICGDALTVLKTLPDNLVDCVMTSPPYWALRDYGIEGQLGLEPTFQEYINKLCDIFDEVKRVLKKEGTCWVNMGDVFASSGSQRFDKEKYGGKEGIHCGRARISHSTIKEQGRGITNQIQHKCLLQIPSRFSIEMCNRGWILRNVIIWYKPNCMPSSARDRFTVDFEYLYFFVKNKKYYFERQFESQDTADKSNFYNPDNMPDKHPELERGKEIELQKGTSYGTGFGGAFGYPKRLLNPQGRNKRCVWKIPTQPYPEAHFATYPEKLCITPIKAGCKEGGIVLDPFAGAGTTCLVAKKLNRQYIGIELNPEYIKIAEQRIERECGGLI